MASTGRAVASPPSRQSLERLAEDRLLEREMPEVASVTSELDACGEGERSVG